MKKKQEYKGSGCLTPLFIFLLLWFVSKDDKYQEKSIKSKEISTYSTAYTPNFTSYTSSTTKNRGKCSITTCCDGTCSKSTGRGTCSHHGGICN